MKKILEGRTIYYGGGIRVGTQSFIDALKQYKYVADREGGRLFCGKCEALIEEGRSPTFHRCGDKS